MGYELRLHVCSTLYNFAHDGESFYNPDYMINLYTPGYDTEIYELASKHLHNDKPEIVWYTYVHGVNENREHNELKFVQDSYGSYPTPCPIDDVIKALEIDNYPDSWRRFDIALTILNSIREVFPYAQVFFEGH